MKCVVFELYILKFFFDGDNNKNFIKYVVKDCNLIFIQYKFKLCM